jgi:hypothetical protein
MVMKKILAGLFVMAFAISLTACASLSDVRKLEDEAKQTLSKCEASATKAEDAAMRAEKSAAKAEEMANKAEAMADKCEQIFKKRMKK